MREEKVEKTNYLLLPEVFPPLQCAFETLLERKERVFKRSLQGCGSICLLCCCGMIQHHLCAVLAFIQVQDVDIDIWKWGIHMPCLTFVLERLNQHIGRVC